MTAVTELNFVFQQPSTPLSINKANSMHWATKRRYMEPWRMCIRAAYIRYTILRELPIAPVVIEFQFTFPKNVRRDPHNYIAPLVKGLIDELVDLHLVPDDNAEWVSVVEPKLRVDKDNLCYVKISLRDNDESHTN